MGGGGRVENGGVCDCMRINEHVLIKTYKRDGVFWRFGVIKATSNRKSSSFSSV